MNNIKFPPHEPIVGQKHTDHFCFVGLVLDANQYAVLWANKTIPADEHHYFIDLQDLIVISYDRFKEITKYTEVVRPEADHAKDYKEKLATGELSPIELPQTEEEYRSLLEKENPKDDTEIKELTYFIGNRKELDKAQSLMSPLGWVVKKVNEDTNTFFPRNVPFVLIANTH